MACAHKEFDFDFIFGGYLMTDALKRYGAVWQMEMRCANARCNELLAHRTVKTTENGGRILLSENP